MSADSANRNLNIISRLRFHRILEEFNNAPTPHPRSGHRLLADESNLYLVGGYVQFPDESLSVVGEVWRFNLLTQIWSKLEFENNSFELGASHSALLLGSTIIIHGGTGSDFGVHVDNSLTCFDLKNMVCYELPNNKKDNLDINDPIPTYGHSLSYTKLDGIPYLYKYGGALGNVYTSNIYRYNMHKYYWELIQPRVTSNKVAPRYRHDSFIWNYRMFVIGGSTSAASFAFIPVPAFNLISLEWEMINFSGKKPESLRFQSSTQDNNFIYMIGGVAFDEQKRNRTVYCFDLQYYTCTKIGKHDSPAYFHDVAFVPQQRKIYSFGGVVHVEPVVRTNHLHEFALNDQPLRLENLAWRSLHPLLTVSTNALLKELFIFLSKSPSLLGLVDSSNLNEGSLVCKFLSDYLAMEDLESSKISSLEKPSPSADSESNNQIGTEFLNFSKIGKFLIGPLPVLWAHMILKLIHHMRSFPDLYLISERMLSNSSESIYLDAVNIEETKVASDISSFSTVEEDQQIRELLNRRVSIFQNLVNLIADIISGEDSSNENGSDNDLSMENPTSNSSLGNIDALIFSQTLQRLDLEENSDQLNQNQSQGETLIFYEQINNERSSVHTSSTFSDDESSERMSIDSNYRDEPDVEWDGLIMQTSERPRRGDISRRGIRGGPFRNSISTTIRTDTNNRGTRRRRNLVFSTRDRPQPISDQTNEETSSDFEYDQNQEHENQTEASLNTRNLHYLARGLNYILSQLVGDFRRQRDPELLRRARRLLRYPHQAADAAAGTTATIDKSVRQKALTAQQQCEVTPVMEESLELLVILLFALGVPVHFLRRFPSGDKILEELRIIFTSIKSQDNNLTNIFQPRQSYCISSLLNKSAKMNVVQSNLNASTSSSHFAKKND